MVSINFDRRNFISTGLSFGLMSQLYHEPFLSAQEKSENNNSVIFLHLNGGPTQFETFNVTNSRKENHQSVIGAIRKHEISLGGLFTNLVEVSDKFDVVSNFTHTDTSHEHGSHWVNTGHYNSDRSGSAQSKYPSHGSIAAYNFGTNQEGVPSYVLTNGGINGSGPAFLGNEYGPFNGNNVDNLRAKVEELRLNGRRDLLSQLDNAEKRGAVTSKYKDMSDYQRQSFETTLGNAKLAFDIERDWPKHKDLYGDTSFGKQAYLARRLVSFGSKFVGIQHGGWDNHANIKDELSKRIPEIDRAIYGLITDLFNSNLYQNCLIIITGEFGRTSKNVSNGRDHWSLITPLLLAGGKYCNGRIIGEVNDDNYEPKGKGFGPIDLQATIFDHLGIPKNISKVDHNGRPRNLLDGQWRIIS